MFYGKASFKVERILNCLIELTSPLCGKGNMKGSEQESPKRLFEKLSLKSCFLASKGTHLPKIRLDHVSMTKGISIRSINLLFSNRIKFYLEKIHSMS